MNRKTAVLFLAMSCVALCGCLSRGKPRDDENLRRRVEAFCEVWRSADTETAYLMCSHNFRTAMDRALFERFLEKMEIESVAGIALTHRTRSCEVLIKIVGPGGIEYTLLTGWCFERNNWFLDIIEWR